MEKIRLYGVLKTKWRCPECLRGLLTGNQSEGGMCSVHGYIEKPLDLSTAPEHVKMNAIDLAFLKFFEQSTRKTYTIDDLHRMMGINKEYARKYLSFTYVDTETGENAKNYYERVFSIKILLRERGYELRCFR